MVMLSLLYLIPVAKYIPYTVAVRATTSAGAGKETKSIAFTEEGSTSIVVNLFNIITVTCTEDLTLIFVLHLQHLLFLQRTSL